MGVAAKPAEAALVVERRLSAKEVHDLGILIKDRARVLKAHADEQAAACLADFERKVSATFAFDSDDVWKRATEEAMKVIAEGNKKIAERCAKLGIPKEFAPGLHISWSERGQNAISTRRTELRRVAISEIEAMKRAAITKIERQSLDLRTQIISMGVMSQDAKLFLESLAPVEDAMGGIDFAVIDAKMKEGQQKRLAGRRPGDHGA